MLIPMCRGRGAVLSAGAGAFQMLVQSTDRPCSGIPLRLLQQDGVLAARSPLLRGPLDFQVQVLQELCDRVAVDFLDQAQRGVQLPTPAGPVRREPQALGPAGQLLDGVLLPPPSCGAAPLGGERRIANARRADLARGHPSPWA